MWYKDVQVSAVASAYLCAQLSVSNSVSVAQVSHNSPVPSASGQSHPPTPKAVALQSLGARDGIGRGGQHGGSDSKVIETDFRGPLAVFR